MQNWPVPENAFAFFGGKLHFQTNSNKCYLYMHNLLKMQFTSEEAEGYTQERACFGLLPVISPSILNAFHLSIRSGSSATNTV